MIVVLHINLFCRILKGVYYISGRLKSEMHPSNLKGRLNICDVDWVFFGKGYIVNVKRGRVFWLRMAILYFLLFFACVGLKRIKRVE